MGIVVGAEAESFYSLYRLSLLLLRPAERSNGLNGFEECSQLGRRFELRDRSSSLKAKVKAEVARASRPWTHGQDGRATTRPAQRALRGSTH